MRVILHDLDPEYQAMIDSKCDRSIAADGKYAPCQGCFGCWTHSSMSLNQTRDSHIQWECN